MQLTNTIGWYYFHVVLVKCVPGFIKSGYPVSPFMSEFRDSRGVVASDISNFFREDGVIRNKYKYITKCYFISESVIINKTSIRLLKQFMKYKALTGRLQY